MHVAIEKTKRTVSHVNAGINTCLSAQFCALTYGVTQIIHCLFISDMVIFYTPYINALCEMFNGNESVYKLP